MRKRPGYPSAILKTRENYELGGGFWVSTITAPQACEGNANSDGVVDPLDAGFVWARFGECE